MATMAKSAEHPLEEKDQTVQPHGWLGYYTGWLMGLLNRKLNRITVYHLELNVDDAVLEIGCGAGLAIHEIFTKSLCHRVAGIDPSPEMIEQSAHLNATQKQAGQLDLRQGKVEAFALAGQILYQGVCHQQFSHLGFTPSGARRNLARAAARRCINPLPAYGQRKTPLVRSAGCHQTGTRRGSEIAPRCRLRADRATNRCASSAPGFAYCIEGHRVRK